MFKYLSYIIVAFVLSSCVSQEKQKSNFLKYTEEAKWENLKIEYKIRVNEDDGIKELERFLLIEDVNLIKDLVSKFRVKEFRNYSIGVINPKVIIKNKVGADFNVSFTFEDTVIYRYKENRESVGVAELDSDEFYDALREICEVYESQYYPDITSKHIMLRTNLDENCYPVIKTKNKN